MKSIREGYATSINASSLKTAAETHGATDYLIASAWTPGHMGSLLRRVQGEWDGTAKKLRMEESDYVLLMAGLKTLPAAIHAAAAWCAKRGDTDPFKTAKDALHWWLDNTCHACHGRGSITIPGTPTLGETCKRCGGSGKRKEPANTHAALDMMVDSVGKDVAKMRNHLHEEDD